MKHSISYSKKQTVNRARRQSKKTGNNLTYMLLPIISVAAVCHGADDLLKYRPSDKAFVSPNIIPSAPIRETPIATHSNSIVLKADHQGHFRGTAFVNNIPMAFLIDTGTTITAIPAKMVGAAGLPFGRAIQANTAGGQIIDHMTRISSFQIGMLQINNLDAQINDYLNEILIGVNVLRYFHITQSGNTLVLNPNNQIDMSIANADTHVQSITPTIDSDQPMIKIPTTIKKMVSCNKRKVCRTIYTDR